MEIAAVASRSALIFEQRNKTLPTACVDRGALHAPRNGFTLALERLGVFCSHDVDAHICA